MARNKDDSSALDHPDLLPATVSQDKSSIGSTVPREPNNVRENLAAFFLARLLETGAEFPDNGVAFMHGKPHKM